MKKLLKKSLNYAFTIIPLAAIIFTIGFKRAGNFNSISRLQPVFYKNPTTGHSGGGITDLPCGFVSKGKLPPQKPTFVTNNYVPVLQYPSGNFPGTTTQLYNSIYSEHQTDQLIIQEDGNLVIYCVTCNPVKALWSAQTRGKDGKTLFFQSDGDLVLKNSFGKTVWHSNIHSTCKGSDQAYFTLQDDGNLLMLFNEGVDGSNNGFAYYLGSTGSTNDQLKSGHPGKIQ